MKYVFQGSKNPDADPAEAIKLGDEMFYVGSEVELSAAELEFYSSRLLFDPVDDKAAKSLDRVEEKAAKDFEAGATDAEKQVLGLGEFAEGAADNSGTEEVK